VSYTIVNFNTIINTTLLIGKSRKNDKDYFCLIKIHYYLLYYLFKINTNGNNKNDLIDNSIIFYLYIMYK
jgi:hypothetical protein